MGEFVISKDGQNYLPQDKEYIKISDWLSEDYGFCHDGFKLGEEEREQEIQEEKE